MLWHVGGPGLAGYKAKINQIQALYTDSENPNDGQTSGIAAYLYRAALIQRIVDRPKFRPTHRRLSLAIDFFSFLCLIICANTQESEIRAAMSVPVYLLTRPGSEVGERGGCPGPPNLNLRGRGGVRGIVSWAW